MFVNYTYLYKGVRCQGLHKKLILTFLVPRSLDRERSGPEKFDLKYETIGPPVELHMSSFQKWLNKLLAVLLSAISIISITNQNRSCNGTFQSRSFRQVCAVRNEDWRYENKVLLETFYVRQNDCELAHFVHILVHTLEFRFRG